MKNDFLEFIKSRRSIKKFKPNQISPEKLDAIMEAALYASSGENKQTWHFSVIQNPEVISKMNADVKSTIINGSSFASLSDEFLPRLKAVAGKEAFSFFYNAPTVIWVSGADNSIYAKSDIALASENLMLAAHAVGLGSCWINAAVPLFEGDKAAEYLEKLQIPQGYTPSHAIIVGEIDGDAPKAASRKENTVSYIK